MDTLPMTLWLWPTSASLISPCSFITLYVWEVWQVDFGLASQQMSSWALCPSQRFRTHRCTQWKCWGSLATVTPRPSKFQNGAIWYCTFLAAPSLAYLYCIARGCAIPITSLLRWWVWVSSRIHSTTCARWYQSWSHEPLKRENASPKISKWSGSHR